MDFAKETVQDFFGKARVCYTIPNYQRAYSWEEQQLNTFFEDLIENSGAGNPYCYGNIMLETIAGGKEYDIIDGQQRLTTILLFIRAFLNIASAKGLTQINVPDEERIYFKDYGIIKLRPTATDRACYETIIVNNKRSFACMTPSQKRVEYAKHFFEKKLDDMPVSELIKIWGTLQNAIINRIELKGKKEAALMFELQNNRGKELTNLEKLKSFLMYQMYVYSAPLETEINVQYVASQFDSIYVIVNEIDASFADGEDETTTNISEDNILLYYSYAYSKKHFGYRKIEDIIDEFKAISKGDKVQWIKDYSLNLYSSFMTIKSALQMKDEYLDKLKKIGMPSFVYPFIIKTGSNVDKLKKLYQLMEIVAFRHKVIGTRADIRSRLNDILANYRGDLHKLSLALKEKLTEAYYWSDQKLIETLNGNMYQNSMINYFLWEYEQDLQRKGYLCGSVKIKDESIEHISPQTENGEKICSGYEVGPDGFYAQAFRDKYLNNLGNLVLISQSHNSSIKNQDFAKKLSSYLETPILRQQMQIKQFVADLKSPKWDSAAIEKRCQEMISFALERWKFLEIKED